MAGRFNDGLKSCASDEWSTPGWLFDLLDRRYHFGLDAAATRENALCSAFLTEADDALTLDWRTALLLRRNAVWLNPPYSKADAFLAKASAEADGGLTVVCLIPYRPDTQWFAKRVRARADAIIEIEGRLQFGGAQSSAPFPSAIVVYETPMAGVQWARRYGVLSARRARGLAA